MRVMFIGESWYGSCARSLREALRRRADVEIDEVNEDSWFTKPRSICLRAINRLTTSTYRREYNEHIMRSLREAPPDVFMAYKGNFIHQDLLDRIRKLGIPMVNVYPDCSPHAHGKKHRRAIASYDLVVSTKEFHPALWAEFYGFSNRCVFVPQGYDPALHLRGAPHGKPEYDVVMVATYRPEYGQLVSKFADALDDPGISVVIAGNGWFAARSQLPNHWLFPGPAQGRHYVSLLRKAKICIAPLSREVIVDGRLQPGDVDSTRTYELAAASCFFIHRRTKYAEGLYASTEVPMFDSGEELAVLVRNYLGCDEERLQMSIAAHNRAVPAYSVDNRAAEILEVVRAEFGMSS